jgi:nucleotide-binding universal stress UspA family protein
MPLRIRSILAANDRSATAATVVRAAGALSALTEADLHVVHAVELPVDGLEPGLAPPAVEERVAEAREAQREQLRYSIPPTVLVESCEVEYGPPHRVILERARAVAADLIVIGPHRPRLIGDLVLGSTADRLIRSSDAPCLIVRAPLRLPLRRILVPSDLSAGAQHALEVAMVWGAALRMPTGQGGGTELSLLHAAKRLTDGRRRRREEGLRARIADARRETGVESLLTVRAALQEADSAVDAILAAARQEQVDLVVLGTHGRTALGRALVGSVSSAVARRCEMPVLLVPPPPGRAGGEARTGRASRARAVATRRPA